MKFDPLNQFLYRRLCRMGETGVRSARNGIEDVGNMVLGYAQEQSFTFANILPFEIIEERMQKDLYSYPDIYPDERETVQTNFLGIGALVGVAQDLACIAGTVSYCMGNRDDWSTAGAAITATKLATNALSLGYRALRKRRKYD